VYTSKEAPVITATIHPPSDHAEVALQTYRAVLTLARKEQSEILIRARKRGKAYAQKAREKGYQVGLAEGRKEAKEQFSAALTTIVNHYSAAADQAAEDVIAIAHQIVEHVIASYLQEHPDQLRRWILHAVESVKHARNLTLAYNPRYHDVLSKYAHEFQSVMNVVSDPSLGDTDFALQSSAGGISFSWKEMLRTLSEPASRRRR
jgi:flagellar biosynthesis/type III secretory pathway protein FliH